MTKPLDEAYLTWLYRQTTHILSRNPSKTYWKLFRQLYVKEFVWIVPNDDNRVEDGRELRYEFLENDNRYAFDREWVDLPCSFLEMLIALSRRISFETDADAESWFWHLLGNLGLIECNDASRYDMGEVDDAINVVIWRTYDFNGVGGLFPLNRTRRDQQNVELWYQMSAYILENNS